MKRIQIVTMSILTAALLAFGAAKTAHAQAGATEAIPNHPALSDRFSFELGAWYTTSSTSASLGPAAGGTGVIVNFENTLGLEENNVTAIAGFLWRISERWRLEVDYFKLDRNATRTLASSVTWGDTTYNAGETLTTKYDFYDIRVSAGYSFFKRRDKELGVGVGLHIAGIDTSLQTSTGGKLESTDVTAPLPVLNLYGAFALTNEWAVRFRMDWLSLNYDIYSGDIRNVAIDVLYQPFRNVGFGLGFRSLILDVEIDDPKWRGHARSTFTGPAAFVRVGF